MRDRFDAIEVYDRMGLPADELTEHFRHSEQMLMFRRFLFMKIVPNLRKLGLLTPRVREEFGKMGVLQFENMTSTDEEIVGVA
jgi:hypothetical protein